MSFLHAQPPEGNGASRRTWLLVLGGGVLLLGVGFYYGFWRGRSAPEDAPQAGPARTPVAEEPKPRPALPDRAPTESGSLEVTADVEGATVYLDGERVGETPHREERLSPGSYEVRVERPGFQPFREKVRVAPGRRARVAASLAVESPVLRVTSDVPGASVFVDRRYLGTTPLETRDVAAGQHQITVSAEGYDMYADTLEVSAGASRELVVRFKEVRLDEAVAVVHKHRMGSCSGQLLATAAGLRYETSEKRDAFSVSFTRVAEFRVDYLEKNLKVKLAGGRTYNFTEPSGNADALYVFHQKVEAATRKESQ